MIHLSQQLTKTVTTIRVNKQQQFLSRMTKAREKKAILKLKEMDRTNDIYARAPTLSPIRLCPPRVQKA